MYVLLEWGCYNAAMDNTDIQDYVNNMPHERQAAVVQIMKTIDKNIDSGFVKQLSYGMIGWVVPHASYPAGYHANPKLPLPYINLGNQKNYIVLHSISLYGNAELLKWFETEYAKTGYKLAMGKGCVYFKKMDQIPFELVGQLAAKTTAQDYITFYEKAIKR